MVFAYTRTSICNNESVCRQAAKSQSNLYIDKVCVCISSTIRLFALKVTLVYLSEHYWRSTVRMLVS